MRRILVVFDTTEGHTQKIAQRIAEVCSEAGHEVQLQPVAEVDARSVATACDVFIFGGSLHAGKHSKFATKFIKSVAPTLQDRDTAFFSVSLSAAGTESQQQDAWRCVDEFLEETGWQPNQKAIFGGALLYREYGFLKRMLMKRVVASAGGDTDTSKNYDYTDWDVVAEFARSVVLTAN